MSKIWKIALHEYLHHVRNKRFIMGLLSVPLVVVLMLGLIVLIINMEMKSEPIGYVDHAGLLNDPLPPLAVEPPERAVELIAYADEQGARTAVDSGAIAGYFVIPEDYLESGALLLVAGAEVKTAAREQFYDFLAVNLLRGSSPELVARLMDGPAMAVQTPDAARMVSGNNWFSMILPFIAGIIFIIAMFSAGGYLMQAVVDEKENRTIEVLLTSVSPNQFMAGKILGDSAVGLTQIFAWGAFIVIGIVVGSRYADFLQGVSISLRTISIFLFIILPVFLMLAAFMAAVGATVAQARDGQALSGWFAMPVWIPYMFAYVLIENPNAPLSVALSILPMTAPLAMLIRDGMTVVPAWQIAASAAVQIVFAVFAIWLAGRAFRLGMLRYGKRLKWRELFAKAQAGR